MKNLHCLIIVEAIIIALVHSTPQVEEAAVWYVCTDVLANPVGEEEGAGSTIIVNTVGVGRRGRGSRAAIRWVKDTTTRSARKGGGGGCIMKERLLEALGDEKAEHEVADVVVELTNLWEDVFLLLHTHASPTAACHGPRVATATMSALKPGISTEPRKC